MRINKEQVWRYFKNLFSLGLRNIKYEFFESGIDCQWFLDRCQEDIEQVKDIKFYFHYWDQKRIITYKLTVSYILEDLKRFLHRIRIYNPEQVWLRKKVDFLTKEDLQNLSEYKFTNFLIEEMIDRFVSEIKVLMNKKGFEDMFKFFPIDKRFIEKYWNDYFVKKLGVFSNLVDSEKVFEGIKKAKNDGKIKKIIKVLINHPNLEEFQKTVFKIAYSG